MHKGAMSRFQLDLVKNEFSEAFVRAAASKRASDPSSRLTGVEREALAHFEQSVRDFDASFAGAHAPSRRFATVRRADLIRTLDLVRLLREQTITSTDAVRLTELLAKLDLRRRRRARHHEITTFARELGL